MRTGSHHSRGALACCTDSATSSTPALEIPSTTRPVASADFGFHRILPVALCRVRGALLGQVEPLDGAHPRDRSRGTASFQLRGKICLVGRYGRRQSTASALVFNRVMPQAASVFSVRSAMPVTKRVYPIPQNHEQRDIWWSRRCRSVTMRLKFMGTNNHRVITTRIFLVSSVNAGEILQRFSGAKVQH